jgi:hypothetical protein
MLGAIRAAVDHATGLNAVADNSAVTVLAARREQVDGTFEAVECMRQSTGDHVE